MLPQFGFMELLLVAIIALIVVGPKDLPIMMRKLGQFVAKGRSMANEFRAAFDDIARQAELDELRQEIESLKRENAVSEAAADLKSVEQDINRSVMETGRAPGAAPSATRTVPDKSPAPATEDSPAPVLDDVTDDADADDGGKDPKTAAGTS